MSTAVIEPKSESSSSTHVTMMQAAVVEEFGKPLVLREWPKPNVVPGTDPGQDRSLRRLPHRPARSERRLAAEARTALHPRTRSDRHRD